MIGHRKLALGLVMALATLQVGAASPQQPKAAQAPGAAAAASANWAQLSGSDIPLNPDVTLGVLPNGMRYLIEKDAVPAGRASLRLVITAGSMQEQPDQLGLAHVLEHMA